MLKTRLTLVLIVLAGCATREEPLPLPCTYVSNAAGAELEPLPGCAAQIDLKLKFARSHLKQMLFSSEGLAAVVVGGQWYYVKPSGDALQVLTYDNGPDDFSEGLTRSSVNGKVAYFDSTLRQVIAPVYDWGWPFEGGRALVCLGCTADKPDADGHSPIVGGKWGYINKRGDETVPVKFSRTEAMSQ
jgi:hypothetical protein